MFKDVFVLKKTSWHSRLMKFTWNLSHRDFSHMCPYFWLTIFNCLAFPFTFLFKGVFCKALQLLMVQIERLADYIDARTERWNAKYYERLKSDPNALQRLLEADFSKKCNKSLKNFLTDYLYYTDYKKYRDIKDQREIVQDNIITQRWAQHRIEQQKKEESFMKNLVFQQSVNETVVAAKKRINFILKYAKPISVGFLYLLGAATVLVVLWLLWLFLGWIISLPVTIWLEILVIIGLIVGILGAACLFGFGFAYLMRNIDFTICCEKREKIIRILKIITKPIVWVAGYVIIIFKAIYKGGYFFIQMLKNNCPAIKWED